jgi:outer membrane receptor protein involved in Fe transport
LKFNYSLLYNDSYSDKVYNQVYRYNPGGIGNLSSRGFSQTFSLNHVLSARTFYEFKLSRFESDVKWHLYEDPNARPHWLVRAGEGSQSTDYVIDIATEEGQEEFNTIKELGLPFTYFVDPDNPVGYVHPDSSRDPASYSFWRAGNDLSRFTQGTAYWVGRFDLTSQMTKNHQVKFGAELILHDLTLNDYILRAKLAENRDEQIVPFVPDIPPVSTVYHDKYNRHPREFSAYLQDKIELKDMVVNIGIRFDYFHANSNIPVNPRDPNIYDPFLVKNIYKNPDAPEQERVEYTPEERRAFMQKKVKAKTQISPRLGIAYPITDQGMIHFSYGHFFQMPEFQHLYDVPDFKLFSGGGRSYVGNPDLGAQRTVQYELGFSQALTPRLGIDLTVFYRDIRDWVSTGPPIKTEREVVSYVMFENKDYSNVRGITFKLDKRLSHNWSAQVDYSYQVVEGTYSNPIDAFNALLAEQEPRLNLIPLDWDQRQLLNIQLSYIIQSWTVSFIGKYNSGEPYTPVFAKGERVGGTALSGLVTNSSRKPSVHSYDIHLIKRIHIGSMRFSFFLYAYNIFDQRGERSVYADTGTASYTTDPSPGEIPYDPNRIGTVDHLLLRPDWYIAPRQIQFGLSLGF